MRLLFDGYWWENGPPSGRYVLRSILTAWNETFPDDAIGVFTPDRGPSFATVHRARVRPHGVAIMLEMSRHAASYDATISQNFTPVFGRRPHGTFIHDVIYARHPEWFTPIERRYLSWIDRSSKRAGIVYGTSLAESTIIAEHLNRPVVPVGLAVNQIYRDGSTVNDNNLDLPERFILCVGRLNRRKNVGGYASALLKARIISADLPLLIVGQADGLPDELLSLIPRDSVRTMEGVSDEGLRELYRRATLFAFPSLDEGFGLPVIEAMASGSRIALSDIEVFREVAADYSATVFFDPTSPEDMARATREALLLPRPSAYPAVTHWGDVVRRMRRALKEG